MPSDCHLSAQMESLTEETVSFLKSKAIPKLVSDLMTVKELQEQAAGEEAELKELSHRLQEETAVFFEVKDCDGAEEAMMQLLQQEEEVLAQAKRELVSVGEAKEETKKEMDRVKRELDGLGAEKERIEAKAQQWQELRRKETSRAVGHMMRTKFLLDKDNRCVSLQLNNERQVEAVILVPDKENANHTDLKNQFWEKLSKIYKLT